MKMPFRIFIVVSIVLLILYLEYPQSPVCQDLPELEEVFVEDAVFSQSEEIDLFELVKEEKSILISVVGDSMYPTIEEKQQCLCKISDSFNVGDIIVFIKNGIGVAHRIVYLDGDSYVTSGDNNEHLDPIVKEDEILCKIPQRRFW